MPAKTGITTSAVQISAVATVVKYGLLLKADDANTGTVAVGFDNTVTNGTVAATDGIRLYAGSSRFVPVSQLPNRLLTDLWVIGSVASQRIEYDVDSPGWITAALALASATNAVRADPATGTLANTTVYAASLVVKASAGILVSLTGYNSKASAQFIQVHNTATLPADAQVPVFVMTVPASSNFSFDIPLTGLPLSTGITVCNSSTAITKTLGSADCWFTAVYI